MCERQKTLHIFRKASDLTGKQLKYWVITERVSGLCRETVHL